MIEELKKLIVESVENVQLDISQQLIEVLNKCKVKAKQISNLEQDVENMVKRFDRESSVEKSVMGDGEIEDEYDEIKPYKGLNYKVHDYEKALYQLLNHPNFKNSELTSSQLIKIIERNFKSIWEDFPSEYESYMLGGKVRRWVAKVSSILNPKHKSNSVSVLFEKPSPKLYRFK